MTKEVKLLYRQGFKSIFRDEDHLNLRQYKLLFARRKALELCNCNYMALKSALLPIIYSKTAKRRI